MNRPLYCPNCGTLLPAGAHGAQAFSKTEEDETELGWDCYCPFCKWSGDIYPDSVEIANG